MEKIFINRAEFSSIERYYLHQYTRTQRGEGNTQNIYIYFVNTHHNWMGKSWSIFKKSCAHTLENMRKKNVSLYILSENSQMRCEREWERIKIRENIWESKSNQYDCYTDGKINKKIIKLSVKFIKSAVFFFFKKFP